MSYRNYGPCMCGATDCPSCGPAQGYSVIKVWDAKMGRYTYINPEEDDEEQEIENFDCFDPPDPEPVDDLYEPN